jgi:hypothetical protein
MVFCVVTLRGLVGTYQRFGGTYRLHHQDKRPHGITTHIFTAVRTSDIFARQLF